MRPRDKEFKVTYIGGGSMFVPSIANGIVWSMQRNGVFDLNLCLYDINPEKAERMCKYIDILNKPIKSLKSQSAYTLDSALDQADLIIVSVALYDKYRAVEKELESANVKLSGVIYETLSEAIATAPYFYNLSASIKKICPEATLITLVNPTDIMSLYLSMLGIRSAGACVEVEGLRGALSYYLHVPEESIEMTFAGVNHDGWTLALKINGEDGYSSPWRQKILKMSENPDFHPGNYGLLRIFELTGYLRSSAYHHPPFFFESTPGVEEWAKWSGKRENYEKALEKALNEGKPIQDPEWIHPERSLLNYPGTGRAFGRLISAMATGKQEIVPLQVRNCGAVSNIPSDACVEVPTLVKYEEFVPQQVGELPEWFGGITKLLAIQRKMMAEYLIDPSLEQLLRTVSVIPVFASVERYLHYAKTLHSIYTRNK